jgi:RNA polymerase sigma-70 factor (ECF subfamily)
MQISDPDIRLMLAFQGGDQTALSDLYGRWAGPLRRYLERMVRDRATAEELVQETFIRVHGAKERYSPEARFSTWLFRIGRNLALNELDRAHRRMPHLSTDQTEHRAGRTPAPSLVASGPGAESILDSRRSASKLEAESAELPERQRSALWLAAIEGYSYEEIADILGTSISSVKSLVHRARTHLVDAMAVPVKAVAEGRRCAIDWMSCFLRDWMMNGRTKNASSSRPCSRSGPNMRSARAFDAVEARLKSVAEQDVQDEGLAAIYDGLRARLGFDDSVEANEPSSVPSSSVEDVVGAGGIASSHGTTSLLGQSVVPVVLAAAAAIFLYFVLPMNRPPTGEPAAMAGVENSGGDTAINDTNTTTKKNANAELEADIEDELVLVLGYGDEMGDRG